MQFRSYQVLLPGLNVTNIFLGMLHFYTFEGYLSDAMDNPIVPDQIILLQGISFANELCELCFLDSPHQDLFQISSVKIISITKVHTQSL